MSVSSIGQIVSRGQVAQAVVNTLKEWMLTYLDEVERQNTLGTFDLPRPPTPESIHGALDFLSWQKDLTPEVIVTAEPYGEAELFGDGVFSQWYELQVGAVIVGEDESTATQIADLYGAALTATIAGNGDLGGFSERTRLITSAKTEFEDPNVRTVQRTVTIFRTLIEQVVNETTRPSVPVPDGQLPPAPFEATTDSLTVTGKTP